MLDRTIEIVHKLFPSNSDPYLKGLYGGPAGCMASAAIKSTNWTMNVAAVKGADADILIPMPINVAGLELLLLGRENLTPTSQTPLNLTERVLLSLA